MFRTELHGEAALIVPLRGDMDEWIGFADASRILGVRASKLRVRARTRGLRMLRSQGGRNKVQVCDLDLLR